ncbi:hypothetical protein Pmani_010713 [Petrolisthes manimaculis]|uniref:CCHC-type domain-containing protein n=1 Tax=Petrolisthes manimaculis TaxID=1843537 RepID=A0AAE1UH21_9EUCA|nr:hypothetical protein Pmani_010713 [Petrolisthes manimaculis]
MSFLQVFIAAPDIDLLKRSVRKSDWLALGKHYQCEVDASMKKDHIKANVIEYLVEENIVPEIALTLIAGHKSKAELEIQKELKLKQMELEYNERMKKMELECELEMKRIEAGLSRSGRSGPNEQVDVMKYVKLLPVFNEEEVDIFFREFEKLAGSLHIDEDYWALLVRSVFTGRAQEVSSTLSVEDSGDYTVLKSTILKAYDKVPEFYRQKFRNARKDDCMTYGEFANLKERYFDNWCRAVKISGDFEKLRELVLVEEFKRCIDPTLRVFLDEKEVPSLNGIASLADTYSLTHKTFNRVKNVQAVDCQTKQIPKSDTAKVVPTKKDKIGSSQFVCYYCKKPGHTKSSCPKLLSKMSKANALIQKVTATDPQSVLTNPTFSHRNKHMDVDAEFAPFISEGFVTVDDIRPPVPVQILRDTGAAQTLLLEGVLPLSSHTSTGSGVLLQGVGGMVHVPLHRIRLNSGIVSGPVIVGVKSTLPVEGVSLLLGNDLAGDKVTADPVVVEKPLDECDTQALESEIPGIFPSCAVTRAKTRAMSYSDGRVNNSCEGIEDNLGLGNLFGEDANHESRLHTIENVPIERNVLIEEQSNTKELKELMNRAVTEEESVTVPECYYFKFGVLMRKWRPPTTPADHIWETVHQIVLPPSYRLEVMSLAHDTPLAASITTVNPIPRSGSPSPIPTTPTTLTPSFSCLTQPPVYPTPSLSKISLNTYTSNSSHTSFSYSTLTYPSSTLSYDPPSLYPVHPSYPYPQLNKPPTHIHHANFNPF